ncbi:MAG: GNAT superfamily N-acetyltransferase [Bermanella sp.]|jgi:GNAT superfamily N-acetyltransferase
MVVTDEQLKPIAPDEHELLGEIITEGFADDPVNQWAFRSKAAMLPIYTEMARDLYIPKGFGDCSLDKQACSLWLPPNAKVNFGIRASLNIGRALISHAGLQGIRNSLAVNAVMSKAHPQDPHYYLFAIAARPAAQGKGLGGALMRKALARIDSERMPAYLENSKERNIGFYRHFGFDILEKIQARKDAPPLWAMWREPR